MHGPMEHRETLEEFMSQLDSELEFMPDVDSGPVSEALQKAKRIERGEEYLTSLEEKWIERLKSAAVRYLPQANDIAGLFHLASELAKLGLPRTSEILRAISIGMAYQAELAKHHESNNDGKTAP